jgi:hypothetical protein
MFTPSFATGYAYSAGMSANPHLWKGLVAMYAPGLGNQGHRLYDFSGRQPYGEINGATWVVGQNGWALNFPGSGQHVNLGTGRFNLPDGTLVFSFTPHDNSSLQYIFSQDALSNNAGDFAVFIEAVGKIGFGIDTGSVFLAIQGDNVVTVGNRYVVACRWGSSTGISMYVDNVLQADTEPNATDGMTNTSAETLIGTNIINTVPLDGVIHWMAIYDHVLNEPRLSQLYYNPLAPLELADQLFGYGLLQIYINRLFEIPERKTMFDVPNRPTVFPVSERLTAFELSKRATLFKIPKRQTLFEVLEN